MVIYIKTLEFIDLEIAILAIFSVIFAIFREPRRLVATHCTSPTFDTKPPGRTGLATSRFYQSAPWSLYALKRLHSKSVGPLKGVATRRSLLRVSSSLIPTIARRQTLSPI
jgi:hypothetical protein